VRELKGEEGMWRGVAAEGGGTRVKVAVATGANAIKGSSVFGGRCVVEI